MGIVAHIHCGLAVHGGKVAIPYWIINTLDGNILFHEWKNFHSGGKVAIPYRIINTLYGNL